ncbi:MAG: hypothetical protein KDA99_05985, partial [Planctomycetales bacterium]|nr:hypothetical protein [Planctomycetales bacterium]
SYSASRYSDSVSLGSGSTTDLSSLGRAARDATLPRYGWGQPWHFGNVSVHRAATKDPPLQTARLRGSGATHCYPRFAVEFRERMNGPMQPV